LKQLRRLGAAQPRRASGGFVVEGYRLLLRALEAGACVEAVYAAPPLFRGGGEATLVERAHAAGAVVNELAPAAFGAVSTHGRPDGLLAVVRRPPTRLASLRPGAAPLVLVAEGVERPGNLGTIVRSASAAGATALVACDPQTDVFHPRTVTASVGAVFRLPLAAASGDEVAAWLCAHGIAPVVATPEATLAPWDVDLTGPVALVVGCEKRGVSPTWRGAGHAEVAIPMPGGATDSLNVAVAAGVLLVEAARQRLAAARRHPAVQPFT
jgi:TrmH family RNA methyltransferase